MSLSGFWLMEFPLEVIGWVGLKLLFWTTLSNSSQFIILRGGLAEILRGVEITGHWCHWCHCSVLHILFLATPWVNSKTWPWQMAQCGNFASRKGIRWATWFWRSLRFHPRYFDIRSCKGYIPTSGSSQHLTTMFYTHANQCVRESVFSASLGPFVWSMLPALHPRLPSDSLHGAGGLAHCSAAGSSLKIPKNVPS